LSLVSEQLRADPLRAFPVESWHTCRPVETVELIKSRLLENRRSIDIERARYTTQIYQQTEGQPMPVRRAKMLLHLVRKMSIAIDPDELIVGNRSLLPRMGVIAPEGAVDWIDDELDILPTRPQDRFDIQPEQIHELRESIFPFWRGKTLEDLVDRCMPEDVRAAIAGKVFSLNQTDHAQGHILPDVEGWLRLGVNGLKEKVRLNRALHEEVTPEQIQFYAAAWIALQAAEEFHLRYADLARKSANQCAERRRRNELETIAANCEWLSLHPPVNFHQALQAVWFLFVLLQIESNASSFSPGRFDQYMLPYLEKDLDEGTLILEDAQVLLEHLWLKFNQVVLLRSSSSARYFAGFPIGFNLVVGGQRQDGSAHMLSDQHLGDATNLLSYMCLRAQAEVGLTQPNLSIRIHEDSPSEFLQAAAAVIGKGSGMPQVFNDAVIVPGQVARGIVPQDALNYAIVGCVELSTPGKSLGWSDAAMFNMTRVLELTLFGGRDPHTGEQIGLVTPALDELETYTDLELAYEHQLLHFIDLMIRGCKIVDGIHAQVLPSPLLSLVIDDCIKRGVDVTAGGAHYNFSGVQGVQVANVADSLVAVRRAVFEDKWLQRYELLDLLRTNYEGNEHLRQRLIHDVPKYGNDDSLVDATAARWADYYSECVSQYETIRGGVYQPGFYTVSAHVPMGANVGATPDGRRSGEPLADGGLSPTAGRDRLGPTAVMNSVSAINLELASNGTLLNMKFLPSFFKNKHALAQFETFLRSFCQLEIPHVQFNVVSGETLRQAQANPESYRYLVVRVAGYSAYFIELDRELQEEIIRRTEFDRVG